MDLNMELIDAFKGVGVSMEEMSIGLCQFQTNYANHLENERQIKECINAQLKDAILENHEHEFVKIGDGSYDKVCVICGVKVKQAVLK